MDVQKKLIYFVEDDPLMFRVYERLFKFSGFDLEVASNGEEAIESLKTITRKPDVFLLDVMMPKVSGLDVLAFIKQDSNLKDIPVIMFTNLFSKDEVAQATKMGASLYLVKSENYPSEVVEKILGFLK